MGHLQEQAYASQGKFGLGSKMAALSITCPAFTLDQRKSCLHLQCSPALFICAPQINIAKPIAATFILSPLSLVICASHHPKTHSLLHPPPPSLSPPLRLWILLFFSPSLLFSPPLHLNQECSKFYEFIKNDHGQSREACREATRRDDGSLNRRRKEKKTEGGERGAK